MLHTWDDLPKVSGRHRNHALAALRREKALKLRARGMTFGQVASELGYANKGTVFRMVRQAMDAHEAEGVDFLRHVEGSRLDSIQHAVWAQAMAGDYKSMRVVLDVIDRRVKLYGLDRLGDGGEQAPRTVIISGDEGN